MKLERDPYGSYLHEFDPGEPSTGERRVSVTDGEAELLTFLAHGRTVLEIGTGLGVSTRALAAKAHAVCTVDIDPWVVEHIWPTLPPDVIKRAFVPDADCDLVFIDGDHSPEALTVDLQAAARVCKRGTVVVHDTNHDPIRMTCFKQPWDWTFLATHHGMGIAFIGWDE